MLSSHGRSHMVCRSERYPLVSPPVSPRPVKRDGCLFKNFKTMIASPPTLSCNVASMRNIQCVLVECSWVLSCQPWTHIHRDSSKNISEYTYYLMGFKRGFCCYISRVHISLQCQLVFCSVILSCEVSTSAHLACFSFSRSCCVSVSLFQTAPATCTQWLKYMSGPSIPLRVSEADVRKNTQSFRDVLLPNVYILFIYWDRI